MFARNFPPHRKAKMKYQFFLDETGDHGLSFVDVNFPLFLLCGCLIREDKLLELETAINDFKIKYFNTVDVILHSREIRRCEGAFQILFDLELKKNFYKDLNGIISSASFTIIGSGVNKEELIKTYGRAANDPYTLSLSFIFERLIFCLDEMDKDAKVNIKVEKRGKNEDNLLSAHYNSILDKGTYYVSHARLHNVILSLKFHIKRDNVIGLQLADLCAYPLARHLLSPKVPYIPFDIVKEKIYCDRKGNFRGYGLKLFPKK
jgi:hypothetical protein